MRGFATLLALAASVPLIGQVNVNKAVSVTPGGTQLGNDSIGSLRPSISDDGSMVVFQSTSSDITTATDRSCAVENDADQAPPFDGSSPCGEPGSDIYVRNMNTNTTRLVSHLPGNPASTGGEQSEFPRISPNGLWVVYRATMCCANDGGSVATFEIVPRNHPTLTAFEAYRWSSAGDTNTMPSEQNGTLTSDGTSPGVNNPVVSADGRYVVFSADGHDFRNLTVINAANSEQIYEIDMQPTPPVALLVSGKLVAGSPSPTQACTTPSLAVGGSEPRISANGRRIVFRATCSDLVANFSNPKAVIAQNTDVYIRDMDAGTTKLVSKKFSSSNGCGSANCLVAANGLSSNVDISPDGNWVVFTSQATDLVNTTDSNGGLDVFLYNVATDTVSLISVNNGGTGTGNGASSLARTRNNPAKSISIDNRFVTFGSTATDVAPAGIKTSNRDDVFLRDLIAGTTRLISARADGHEGNAQTVGEPYMIDSGRQMAFATQATDLVTGMVDGNGASNSDIILRDAGTATSILVSHVTGSATTSANAGSQVPVLTPTGSHIAYESFASNLVTGISDPVGNNDNIYYSQLAGSAPGVSKIDTTPTTADNKLVATEVIPGGTAVTALKVTYLWEVVFAPFTLGSAGNYTDSTGNYLLVSAGANHLVDTSTCTVSGDDVAITINSATYARSTFTSTLSLASALADNEKYKLFVCSDNRLTPGTGFIRDVLNQTMTANFSLAFKTGPAPTVTNWNSVVDTGDATVAQNEIIKVPITQLLSTFSLSMDATAASASNFKLVSGGANNTVEAGTTCSTTAGDDVVITINTASYDGPSKTTTLSVNGGSALLPNFYKVFACAGLTSVGASLQLNDPLNGSGLGLEAGGVASFRNFSILAPDLAITKSHTGNFKTQQVGATYTLHVSNAVVAGSTVGTVTVHENAPGGLTVTAMAGGGWTCTVLPDCTRSDTLAGGAAYPDITVTVTVTGGAGTISNQALVSGGAEMNATLGDNTANDSTVIVGPPTVSKNFGVASVPLGGTTSLNFSITNPNLTVVLTGVGFTDTLPAGLTVPDSSVAQCGGTLSSLANVITLTGASVTNGVPCGFIFTVTGATAGAKNNTTGAVVSNEGGPGATSNTATLAVVAPPTIAKAFGASFIGVNATTTVTFTITNPAANSVLQTGLAFSDTLPAGLLVANTPGVLNFCGGTVTATANTNVISLVGGTVGVNTNCALTVNVTATSTGVKNNTTGTVSSTTGGTGTVSNTATITVASPPTISKAFLVSQTPLNGTTTLTFTLNNPNTTVAMTGVAFTDSLPAGLVVAAAPNVANTCNGSVVANPGSGTISFASGTIVASGSCALSVDVTGTTAGVKNNTTGAVSSTEGGTGIASNSAALTVVAPPTISKAIAASIPLNGTTAVTFTISNSNSVAFTGVAFSDTLPAGLAVASTPNVVNTCNGTVTATGGAGTIGLSAGTVSIGGSCTLSVDVTGTTAGNKPNTTGAVSSTEGGTGAGSNTATVTVVAPPTIAKAFGASSIPLSGSSTVTFTITNPAANAVAETGVAFGDTLPAGLTVANTPGVVNTCAGSVTAIANSGSISLSGGAVGINTTCTLTVNVTGTTEGLKSNTTGAISSTNGGTGAASNTATVTVAAPPTISKAFGNATIPNGGTTSLTFNISNPNTVVDLSGLAFTDTLPAGLVVAAPNGLTNTCGGSVTAIAGSGSIALSAGTLVHGTSCAVVVNVTGTSAGAKNNSVTIASAEGGTGNTSSTSVTVVAPPVLIKAFGAASISLNSTTALQFTISNPNAGVGLANVGFTDTLPSATATLLVATPNGLVNGPTACNGTITATQATDTISLSGATLAPGASCTFTVNVVGTAPGTANNTSGSTTSAEGGNGGTASASVFVVAPPSIAKVFGAPGIPLGGSTSLTFTITNPAANTQPENGIAFSDSLTNGLVVATPNGITNTCGGTATAGAGSTSVTLTGGSIATPGNTCTVAINVTGTVAGTVSNTSGAVTSTNGGTGNTANATMTVAAPPVIGKVFGAATIPVGGTTSLTFNISNSNAGVAYTGLSFTDSLPAGLVVANPNALTNTCNGTVTANPGTGTVSLSAGTLAVSSSCAVVVNVTGTTGGVKNNSVTISATESGAGNTSNTSITVVAPPVLIKAFGAASISLNGATTLQFTISNPNAGAGLTGVGFTDTLPTGNATLLIATPNGLLNGPTACNGTITATQGAGVVSLAGATLAPSASCTFTINVTGTLEGTANNTSGNTTSAEGGNGGTASASVFVVAPPSISKAFGATGIPLNGSTSLTFTITNPAANTQPENGIAFSDTLTNGLVVATPNGLSSTCGGSATAVAGSTSVTLTGGTIATPGNTCTVAINVTGTVAGTVSNTSSAVSSTNGGTGNTATATMTVAAPPVIGKVFGAATIPLNGTTSLTFNISNPNAGVAYTGLSFTDNLPAGLVVANPNALTNTCGGTATANAGSGVVSLSAGTLAISSSCSVVVNVTGTTAGVKNNSVTISAAESGVGNTSNTSITVVAPPTLIKAFGAASISRGASTSLQFTISNPNTTVGLTGVGFTDTLPTGNATLVVSSPNGLVNGPTACNGTITATQATGVISLAGASLGANASCTFTVSVTGTMEGLANNATGNTTSVEGGNGGTASASITVVAPPSISKAFGAAGIPLNGSTSLTFTITNPVTNTTPENGIAFSDALTSGLVVATPNGLTNTCGGAATATAGSTSITLTGGTIATPGATCTLALNVTGTVAGVVSNTSSAVTSTNGGTGNTANATLNVAAAPTVSKAFGAASVLLNGSTSLNFTIANPNASVALSGIAFTDALPAGLRVSTPSGLTTTCAGNVTAAAGSGSVSLAGGSLASNSNCTIGLNVTGIAASVNSNTTGVISATESGPGATSNTAVLTVIAPPSIGKVFGATAINLGASTTLTFTLGNSNTTVALTGVAFNDSLPAGLVVSTPNGLAGSCGGGTITATAGSNIVSLAGATLPASGSCTFAVNVTGALGGTQVNTTSAVTAANGGSGNQATASMDVLAPDTTITKTHTGNFNHGQIGATYTITVSNTGFGPTVGTVTVVDTVPAVPNTLVATAISGSGWSCVLGTLTCTRADGLASGSSYPAITLTVNVPLTIQSGVTNTATVSGGGDVNAGNNVATDVTTIGPGPAASITAIGGTPQTIIDSGTAIPFQALVSDAGGFPVPGVTVTFTAAGGGTFSNGTGTATGITDASGIATAPAFALSGAVGAFTVTASAPGVATTAKFTVTVIHSNVVIAPNALFFTYSVGDPSPILPQTIGVSADVPFSFTVDVSPSNSWLVATGSGVNTGSSTITVSVKPAGLTPRVYVGSVIVNFNNGSAINVPVTLTVVGPPVLVASPPSLNFTAVSGQGAPPPQTLLIGAQNRNVDFTFAAVEPWITVTTSRTTTPAQLIVSVDPNNPALPHTGGPFTGTIKITSAGATNSPLSIPVTLTFIGGPVISAGGILNAASLLTTNGAPNTIMSLFGTFTCTSAPRVFVNDQEVEVIGYTGNQINFTLPPSLNGANAAIKVDCNGQQSPTFSLPLSGAAPGIFTALMTGTGQGAVINSDSTVNSAANPEHRKYVSIFGTGFGAYLDPGPDGLQHTVLDVQAFIGEKPAQVLFAGHAPNYTLGLQQINVLIPADAPNGSAVSLRLRINGVDSQSSVTLAIGN